MLTVYTVVVDKTGMNKLLKENGSFVTLFMDEILWHENVEKRGYFWLISAFHSPLAE